MVNMNRLNRKRFNFLFVTVLAIAIGVTFYFLPDRIYLGINDIDISQDIELDGDITLKSYPYNDILADSYIIYDNTAKKILIQKDNTLKPLASVTKLMTALVSMRYCQDTIIYQDENIKKAEAVEMMLVESSNEIAEALANICPNRQDFIDNMNNTAKDLGLSMTFINPSGLDENNETESSAFGSPLDVAILINRLYLDYPTILESTSFSVFNGIKNTNNYASNWPFLLGSKTGYTDVAHGNLAILFEPIPNKRVSIVVLGSTKDGRFTDVQKLMNWYLKRL